MIASSVELLNFGSLPVMENRTYLTESAARDVSTGSVHLVQDLRTGLIYNQAWRNEQVVYDPHYQNEQAYSPTFQRHLRDVVRTIRDLGLGETFAEIGCGKGYFLGELRKCGLSAVGLDQAYEGDDPRITKEHYRPGMTFNVDCVVLRHVLEHIDDPVSFLAAIAESNGRKGFVYIEAPCFEWVCSKRSWLSITHEYVNYFRISDFNEIFGEVVASGHCFGGQYLFVVAQLSSIRDPGFTEARRATVPEDFTDDISWYLGELDTPGRNVVWGASSKGVLFSVHMSSRGGLVDAVVDVSPEKQGRFLPVTGLEVLDPSTLVDRLEDQDKVFVMNVNYLDEVVERVGERCRFIAYPRAYSRC